MSRIGLQALSLRVVPQLECVVEGRGKNVLSIGREFHKRHWRIVIVNESLQALTTCCVPNATKSVVAGRDDERTVAVEVNSGDRIRMSWKRFQALARPNIPNAHGLVEAARHDEIALRVEVATEDVIAVAFEGL